MDGSQIAGANPAGPSMILLTALAKWIRSLAYRRCDDYVANPSACELTARVKAALRRLRRPQIGGLLVFIHVRIDVAARLAWFDDQPVELTAMEFDLLHVLAEHAGMALSREQLLEKVWGTNYGETRVVDVHIGHLRRRGREAIARAWGGLVSMMKGHVIMEISALAQFKISSLTWSSSGWVVVLAVSRWSGPAHSTVTWSG
jgi:DNA-binding response OmpR family regulator